MLLRRVCVAAATVAALGGCGESTTAVPEPLDARITILLASQAAWVSDTLVATLHYDGPDRDSLMMLPVTWTVSDTVLATLLDVAGPAARLVPRHAGQVLLAARAGDAGDTAPVIGWEEGEAVMVHAWATDVLTQLHSLAVGTDGRVYLLRYDDAVLAFAADLTPVWEAPLTGPGWMNVAIADDGSVIVPSIVGLFAFTPAGVPRWQDTTFSAIETAPAIDGQGHVWLGGFLGRGSPPYTWGVAHYDAAGTRVAFLETGRTIKVPPVIALDSVVVIGDLGNRVFGIARNDSILWVDTLPGALRYFPPAVAGDGRTVYVPTRDGPVVALDGLTGQVHWTWQGAGTPTSPIVDADGTIYVQTQISLVALKQDGSVAWQADSLWGTYGINALGAPALANGGVLYVACQRDVCAVNTVDGSVRWRRALPEAVSDDVVPGAILILPDHSILFSTVANANGPAYLVKLRGRFPLADAPWPVDGRDLRRTRRGRVP